MPSFIDLMANDVWSNVDIKARLHAEIRSEVSQNTEAELNRALQGAALGMHTLTASEKASLKRFKAVVDRTELLGTQARMDMVLLAAAFEVERAQNRLAQLLIVPSEDADLPDPVDPEAIAVDVQERLAAQTVLDGASENVLALVLLRNPEPQLEPDVVVE